MLAGKFSVPFAVATRLVSGSSRVENFTWDALRDSRCQALAKRVFIVEDKAMTAKAPQFRPAQDRSQVARYTAALVRSQASRGDDQDPYSRD